MPFAAVAELATVRIESAYLGVNEASLAALTRVITDDQAVTTDTAELDLSPRLMQIETCRRQGLKVCPILRIGGSGTGFIDNGRKLFTCRHVVGDWPLAASLLNNRPVREILPPVIVRDRDGRVLYNSAYSSNSVRFESLNEDPRLNGEAMLRYRAHSTVPLPQQINYIESMPYLIKASDFVALSADTDLIRPVVLAHGKPLTVGDRIYLSGFPVKTDLPPRPIAGVPDLLLVTSSLTTRVVSPAMPMLMAEGLQSSGGSGALVTDADGRVVGMSCFADTGKAFAFSFDAEAQQRFWNQLAGSPFADIFALAGAERRPPPTDYCGFFATGGQNRCSSRESACYALSLPKNCTTYGTR